MISDVRAADDFPKFEFRNAHLTMTVMTPDAKKGFYRGSRFDWSGIIRDVQYNTRVLFNPWKAEHKPENHDDVTGPAEEFRTPLGYDTAKEGEGFLKIGVGTLVKPKEEAYRFDHNYEIKYPGLWEVTRSDDDVVFKQGMLTASGYGYKYTKTLGLLDTTSGFTISHELHNVGTKPISTEWRARLHYNIDKEQAKETIGAKNSMIFPFAAKAAKPNDAFTAAATIRNQQLAFSATLDQEIAAEIEGFGQQAAHHGYTIQHSLTRVALHMTCDEPLAAFHLTGTKTVLCPETTVRIEIRPGETKKWTATYKIVTGYVVKR